MRFSFVLYMIALVFAVTFFGAVHAYAYSTVFLLVLGATVPVLLGQLKRDYRRGLLVVSLPSGPWAFLFIALAVVLLLQILPLPASWVALLSPKSYALQQAAAQFGLVAEVKDTTFMTLAPYPFPVRQALVRLLVYGFFFFGLLLSMPTRKRVMTAVVVLTCVALGDLLYGMIETYGGHNHIFWYAKQSGELTGTYINRNHFAGFLALVFPLTAVAVLALGRGRRRSDFSWKERLRRLIENERLYSRQTMLFFCAVLLGLGLLLSASRGGIIAGGTGLLTAGILLSSRRSTRKSGRIFLVLFLVTAIYGVSSGLDRTITRFKHIEQGMEIRTRFAHHTMDLAADYPLTGIGVGLFRHGYPAYQSNRDKKYFIDYAHNDWAQFIAETGWPGFMLLVSGLLWAFWFHLRKWRKRHDRFAVVLGVAAPAALVTIGIHSWTDFNLHLPANFMVLAAIVALSTAALANKKQRAAERFEPQLRQFPVAGTGGGLLLVIGLTLAWTGKTVVASLYGETLCNTVHNSTLNRERYPSEKMITQAIAHDSANAAYFYRLAEVRIQERDLAMARVVDLETEQRLKKRVTRALEQTVQRNPLDGRIWVRLGWEYTFFWQDPDYHQKWLPMADRAMELAVSQVGSKHTSLHEEVGNYWVMRSRQADPATERWERCLTKAEQQYIEVISSLRGKARDKALARIEKAVWVHYPADSEVARRLLQPLYNKAKT